MKLTKNEMKVLLRVLAPLLDFPMFRGKRNEYANTDALVDWIFSNPIILKALDSAIKSLEEEQGD